MVSCVVIVALGTGSSYLHHAKWQRYNYHQLWGCQVGASLTTLTLRRSVQHINHFYLSNSICHAAYCVAWKYLCVWWQESAMLSCLWMPNRPNSAAFPGVEHWAVSTKPQVATKTPRDTNTIQVFHLLKKSEWFVLPFWNWVFCFFLLLPLLNQKDLS